MPVSERGSRLLLFLLGVAAAAAMMLLLYDGILLGRVVGDRARHIGGDVVAFAYAFALFCSAAASVLLSPLARGNPRGPRWLVAGLCLCAAAVWFVLHGGGFIYSHESMFRDR